MDMYPKLSEQYQTMIGKIVDEITGIGGIVILDLHWNDDDNEQQNMALKAKSGTGGSVEFWESVSETFAGNDHVFYELYNEPHNNETDVFIHGDDTYAGMLDMIAAVRKNSAD
jgi:protein subunit release factor A